MTERRYGRSLRPALIAVAFTLIAVGAALSVRPVTTIEPGDGPLWRWMLDDGFSLQPRYAWTSEEAVLRVPGAGRGAWDLELELSGWRPRGRRAPRVVVRSGDASHALVAGRARTTVALPVVSRSWLRAAVDAEVRSDTFVPGAPDLRVLGARVYGVRLLPKGGSLGVPPLVPLLLVSLAVGLIVVALGPSLSPRRSVAVGVALGIVAGGASLLFRAWMIAMLPVVLVVIAACAAGLFIFRETAESAGASLLAAARGGVAATRDLAWPGMGVLVLVAGVGLVVAHRSQTVVVIDPATRAGRTVAAHVGPPNLVNGRHAVGLDRGSRLELEDLGGGGRWRVSMVAASASQPRRVALARIEGQRTYARLGRQWETYVFETQVPFRWRAGTTIALSQPARRKVLLSEVRIDRGGTWPSPRNALALALAGLCLAVALRVARARRAWAVAAGAALILGLVALLSWDPLLGLASIPVALGMCFVAALCAAVVAGGIDHMEQRGAGGAVWRAALPGAVIGFVAWTLVMTFPLYKGGHFVFHSSIAEEIWHGRFMTYYLPYPGSMLSEQAQWGSVKMPHPCAYHTLIAPLAALPRPDFYVAEKVVLGLLLASMAMAAGVVAGRVGSPRAALFASLLVAASAPAFQLLELGHLMALLGCWASSLAMGYLVLRVDGLSQPATRWRLVALLTAAFLAYFASVPFLALSLSLLLALLWWHDRRAARWVVYCAALAGTLAFGLYYVHWAWPFIAESAPRLLGLGPRHVGSSGSELASVGLGRLMRQPDKLTYTFGSGLVPILGLTGLFLARPWRSRAVLLAWGAILPVVCVLDIQFNFLLKHHYYTIVPVCIGGGLLLARLETSARWIRWATWLLLLVAAGLGVRAAVSAAIWYGA